MNRNALALALEGMSPSIYETTVEEYYIRVYTMYIIETVHCDLYGRKLTIFEDV